MGLVPVYNSNNHNYEALSTDIVNGKIVGLDSGTAEGSLVYIKDTKITYTVNPDYTLSPYIINSDLQAGDIQIGAVEIKDGTSDNRAIVGSDGSFKTKIVSQDNVAEISPDGSINTSTTDIVSGKATSGTQTTIVDSTKEFITDMLKDAIIEIDIASTTYFRKIISNTSNTITFPTLPGAYASAIIGTGNNGTVTISSANQGIGGNSYSVEVVQATDPNINLSAVLTGLNLLITLGTDGAGATDATKNTAILISTAIDALEQFTSVYSGTGADVVAIQVSTPFTGGIAIVMAGESTAYKIKSTKTTTNPVPVKKYLSQTQIGSDINFSFLNGALINNQTTPIDVTKPTSPSDEYMITVLNPSTITDLTIKIFAIATSLSGQTRYAYITSLTVPKAATITGTSIDTYSFFIHGIFNSSNCRLQISNNTALGGGDGFTGTLRIREV